MRAGPRAPGCSATSSSRGRGESGFCRDVYVLVAAKPGAYFARHRGTGRFRYCFYLDFLSHAEDVKAKNALSHLSECTSFSKVLGSYPSGSGLVGHVSNDLRTRAPAGDGRGKTDFIDGARAAGAVEGGAVVGKNCEGMKHFSKEEVNAKALRKFGTVMVSSAASELEGHLSSLPSMKGR